MSSDGDSCEHFQFDVIDKQYPVQGKGHSPLTLDETDDDQLATDIPHNNRSPKFILSQQRSTDDSRFEQILKRTKNCDTISDIPYHVREEVKDSLNRKKESGNDWRGVASRMGVKSLTIEKIKKDFKEDPTDKLFHELSNQKITKLLHVLYEMECQDVLNIFYDNFCINISDTGAGVESYQGSKFPSHESTPDSGISSASCAKFVICPEPISPFNVREDPGTPESLESTTSASEFGRIFSQPPHSRPNAGFGVKQNTGEDFDTGAGVDRESYQGSKFPSLELTPGSGISSVSCAKFVICPEPISPFNVREDPGTPESLESTTSASEFGRIFSQPPHSRPNAGFGVKQNIDEDFGSSRESSCVDKKSNESPLVDKSNKEILEETGSPSTETKFRSGLFNIVKSNNITINEEGGCFHVPVASAFLLFPPNAVEEKVTLKFSRVKHKESEVKPRDGEVFVSRILKIEPEGLTFKKPVTVLLSHSLYEDQDFVYFYELIVESLSPTGWQELKTERISYIKDVPKEISNKMILDDYLPFAKATIHETCTIVAATRVRSDQILIPTNESYTFSKQYGDKAELNITFPAGVAEKTQILEVQLFPARAVLNRDIRSDKNLVCMPIIKVSGQKTPFLKAVDIELTYCHSDVGSIEEEFLPVGKRVKFTTEYGLLLRSHKETESKSDWQALNESNDVYIERSRKDQLKFSFSVEHFCYILSFVKRIVAFVGSILPLWGSGMVEVNNPACHSAIALAVHKTDSSPKTLRAVLAPAVALSDVKTSWNAETDKIRKFDEPLKSKEPIYFCVPLSDSHHLPLKDHTLRFDPDPVFPLVLDNNTDDNLNGKYMHFLTDRDCNNGENHSTQGDCHAKAPIHISETRSVQASAERRELVLGSELPQDSTPSFEQKIISINDLSVDACRVGRVTSVTPYGAYVDIGVRGREGLLHKSEFPSSKDLETGDTYSVVCTDVNKTENLIRLRLK